MKKGDTVIIPGFGLMDGDFNARIDRVRPFTFHVSMGLLTQWWFKRDFVKTADHVWTHKDLVSDGP